MVVDSSAFLAILLDEPDARSLRAAVEADDIRLASTATLLESSMVVLKKLGEPGVAELDALLRATDIEATPFDAAQLLIAIDAFRRFGKGRHAAGLNFGDCFAYALARATGERLLFKGEDFSKTDIGPAL